MTIRREVETRDSESVAALVTWKYEGQAVLSLMLCQVADFARGGAYRFVQHVGDPWGNLPKQAVWIETFGLACIDSAAVSRGWSHAGALPAATSIAVGDPIPAPRASSTTRQPGTDTTPAPPAYVEAHCQTGKGIPAEPCALGVAGEGPSRPSPATGLFALVEEAS